VHAGPIVFATSSFDTTAVALADGPAGFDSDIGPPTPVTSSAFAGVNDIATAGAIAAPGLFTASSDASAVVGSAFAVGQSHFLGTILDFGKLILTVDSFILNFGGSGDVFVLLTNNVLGQLVNDDIMTSSARTYVFTIPTGSVTTLDVTVVSEASANAGSGASNFSQATIAGTIPLPATPLLVVAGVGALLASRRRRGIVPAA
jgi:hypothetical protein